MRSLTVLYNAVLGLYYCALLVLFLQGINGYLLIYLRKRGAARVLAGDDALWRAEGRPLPAVTVQLPVYNERYVVARLLEAVTRLDYPRNRLEIQILDDSTDETTAIAAALAERYRREGFHVVLLHRSERTGYKAGALQAGLAAARGELIAIFDADFVPQPDFLTKALPFFRDPALAVVQACWGHLNHDYSLLTRAQALILDGHFCVEQPARCWNGLFSTFDGSAGVWRRAAIADAGGWQPESLAEDLDLSYRAQLRGWQITVLPQVVCPAELPVQISAYRSQQHRWAKGSTQTTRRLLPRLARADLPLFTKYQALLHLTGYLAHAGVLVVALASPLLAWLDGLVPGGPPPVLLTLLLTITGLGPVSLFVYAQRALHPDWKRRILYLPAVFVLGPGVAANNTRGVIEGLLGTRGPFVRTPKLGIERASDAWWGSRYGIPVDWFNLIEALLCLYFVYATWLFAERGNYTLALLLTLYAVGFGAVAFLGLWESLGTSRRRLERERDRRTAIEEEAAVAGDSS